MALAQKRFAVVDAAALELWRVAESGDVDELAALLPRVTNINARNEHGVTALMRAAQDGHVQMVRALLEHGADANIKRNDKFTALALAAFFGHTEVVRVLMEHGADAKAPTRNGTSPQMWATARTFNEVVDQLEQPVVPRKPVVAVVNKPAAPTPIVPPTIVAAPDVPVVRPTPVEVRTLKDPPEIWDLVHEVPRGFDARSAFLTRLSSMKSGFAFRAAVVVVLIGIGVAGVMVLRGVQARNEGTEPAVVAQPKDVSQPNAIAQPKDVSQPPAATAPVTEPHAAAAPEVAAPTTNDNNLPAVSKPVSRARVASSPRVEPRATKVETTETVQPKVAASSEKSEPPVRSENTTKPKAVVPLSPQLISPVKSSAPKAKVIQWP